MASKYQDRRIWMNTGAQAKLKNLALEEKTVERTHAIYRQAAKDIEKEVSEIYLQLGAQSDSGRWEFKGLRHPATRKDITALISAVEKAGLMDFVPEKLSNRMSVLQVKQANIWLKLNEAGKSAHTATKENLLRTMQNSAALWKKAAGAGAESFVGFDRNVCGYMMGMNWADGNFSSRLWNTTQETWEKVRDELGRALANGQPMETTKKRIKQMLTEAHNPNAKGSGGIDYDVERIIRTENAKASTQADMVRWREMGVTKLQWHASFEKNTCEHCADRDGRIYDINRIMDEPPLHPNCRCYFAAYDETNAQFPDTTYYKDEQGDYEEIQWAPYRSVIDEKGQLRSKALPVSDYFWNTSPWTIYRPEKTNLEYEGEIDNMVVDAVERTYTELTDEFPELAERVDSWYNNRITLHRGDSVINGNKLEKIGGLADIEKHQITITYPDGRKGGNMLSQMAEQAQAQYDKQFWSTPKANHTIKHELAHALSDELKTRGVSTDDIIKYATGTKNARKALKIMKEEISDYAGKNMNEAFSETFARAYSQDPTLQNDITARFSDGLRTALNKPKRVTKISVDKATPAKVSTTTTNLPDGVIMRNGKPQVLYHGSPTKGIDEFSIDMAGKNTFSGEKAVYFTDSKEIAEREFSYARKPTDSLFVNGRGAKGEVYERYVVMKNPLDLSKLTDKQIEGLWQYASSLNKYDGKEKFIARMIEAREYGNDQLAKSYLDLTLLGKSKYDGLIARMYPNDPKYGNVKEYAVFDTKNILKIKKKTNK